MEGYYALRVTARRGDGRPLGQHAWTSPLVGDILAGPAAALPHPDEVVIETDRTCLAFWGD